MLSVILSSWLIFDLHTTYFHGCLISLSISVKVYRSINVIDSIRNKSYLFLISGCLLSSSILILFLNLRNKGIFVPIEPRSDSVKIFELPYSTPYSPKMQQLSLLDTTLINYYRYMAKLNYRTYSFEKILSHNDCFLQSGLVRRSNSVNTVSTCGVDHEGEFAVSSDTVRSFTLSTNFQRLASISCAIYRLRSELLSSFFNNSVSWTLSHHRLAEMIRNSGYLKRKLIVFRPLDLIFNLLSSKNNHFHAIFASILLILTCSILLRIERQDLRNYTYLIRN